MNEPREQHKDHLLDFRWLTALRWAAVVGQSLAVWFVHAWMELKLPLGPVALIIGAELLLNLVATQLARTRKRVREWELAAWVVADLVAFTSLLYFTGGPANPFNFFYIVHVAMAAFTLSPAVAWSLVSLSAIGFAGLFARHVSLGPAAESGHVDLYGVWVAYGLCASCLVYFIQRARSAIQQRDQELSEQRELRIQAERLSSLATLAAGAAHELASPLGTIAVVSKELENELRGSGHTAAVEDIALVRSQVERCRKILARMAHTAGEAPGETDNWLALGDLLEHSISELPERQRLRVELSRELDRAELRCPKEALGQALRVLVDNALEASAAGVTISAASSGKLLELRVSDEGEGMAPQVLKRAFDPFFTTKPTGKGMGLGLFLARNVVTGMGGSLVLSSELGLGTHAQILLPKSRLRFPPQAPRTP